MYICPRAYPINLRKLIHSMKPKDLKLNRHLFHNLDIDNVSTVSVPHPLFCMICMFSCVIALLTSKILQVESLKQKVTIDWYSCICLAVQTVVMFLVTV